MPDFKILLWNVEWARKRTERGAWIHERIMDESPDVICLTEAFADLLPDHGHTIESDPDDGYPIHEGRRKVLLWSREPWKDVDRVGHPELPTGRYVSGTTECGSQSLEVLGVCIPWRDAHVRTGRKDREAWEDHRRYLEGLGTILENGSSGVPRVVLGDFNQRIPRYWTPVAVFEQMMEVFGDDFSICTAGEIDGVDGQAIDHVAHPPAWDVRRVTAIPKVTDDGLRLGDHFGLVVELERSPSP